MTLLAAYSFDEASGAAIDASGNGRNVTIGGSLVRVAGHTGTALSQSTTAADSAGPPLAGLLTAAFSIMGWVHRTSNALDGWLMEFKQSGSGDRGVLYIGGNVQSRAKNVAGTVFTAAVAQPTAGTAYHVAATCDGTTLKLFINGAQVASTAFSGGLRTNSTSSSFIDALGSETWLDDARYYDTALDAGEITALMNTPVGILVDFNGGTDAATISATGFIAAVTGTPTYTADSRHGDRGMAVGFGAPTNASTFIRVDQPAGWGTQHSLSLYVRPKSQSASFTTLVRFADTSNNPVFSLNQTGTKFDLRNEAGTTVASTTLNWADQWYRFDLQVDLTTPTAPAVSWRVFDSPEATSPAETITQTLAATRTFARWLIGAVGAGGSSSTRELRYDTFRAVPGLSWMGPFAPTSTTPVAASRSTTWRVLATQAASRSTTWRVLGGLVASRTTTWRVATAVLAARATTWRALSRSTGTKATTWRVLSQAQAARSTTWRVRSLATAARSTSWRVSARTTGSRSTLWRTLTGASASRSTTWSVASTATTVVASRQTTWQVAGRVTSARSTTWRTRALTEAGRSTSWRVLYGVTAARSTTWRVLVRTAGSRGTSWRVLVVVSETRSTTWAVQSDRAPRDIAVRGGIEAARLQGMIEPGLLGRIEPGRLIGALEWP